MRLYETLQCINKKNSVKKAIANVHSDYLAMTDNFSRQSSRVEYGNVASLDSDCSNMLEMNYVQMELATSSASEQANATNFLQ